MDPGCSLAAIPIAIGENFAKNQQTQDSERHPKITHTMLRYAKIRVR